jgi:hypothetical protein
MDRTESTETKSPEFDRLHRSWRYEQARWDVAINDPALIGDLDEAENDRHCDATHEALLAFLMHPATDARQLAIKLNIVVEQGAHAFDEAHKIMEQLASDAHELIPSARPER